MNDIELKKHKFRILWINDNIELFHEYITFLHGHNIEILCASNDMQAFEHIENTNSKLDLIIQDICRLNSISGEMDNDAGIKFLNLIRFQRNMHTPVAFLSDSTKGLERVENLNDKNIIIFQKPFLITDLMSIIKSIQNVAYPDNPIDLKSLFISYNHKDKNFVEKLVIDLKKRGVKFWIDENEIKLGDSLIEKISEGIDNVDYLAVVLSPDSVNSEWVKREIEIAMNQEIEGKQVKVIPILFRECELPSFLKGKLYADFTDESKYEYSLNKIIERISA